MLEILRRVADGLAVVFVLLVASIDLEHSEFGTLQIGIAAAVIAFVGWRIYVNRKYLFN